jgi:1,4-dihydroxy-2-naphthoate octaprenyltransferase
MTVAPARASSMSCRSDIRTKIVSLSSLAIGTSYAVYLTREFSPGLFVLMLFATLCVDMGTTGFNSYYDFVWRRHR